MEKELDNNEEYLYDESENLADLGSGEIVHYNPKYAILTNIGKLWSFILKLMAYATLLCALTMAFFLIQQHLGIATGSEHQPASFFTNKAYIMMNDNKPIEKYDVLYYLFQWGTAIILFAIGIRITEKSFGGYFGIYTLFSIFIPTLFLPFECLGILIGFYLLIFFCLNWLYFLLSPILKSFGLYKALGFPGLKRFFCK